ncbi:MAG: hypothetical protein IPM47_14480 [Sphingobacteriales bacterium]|nr:MAG: hypothetical protein IPM47_14480 [Sphingobacteriales bacterium]
MNVLKIFAVLLTVAGMLLLIYACLAFMGNVNVNGSKLSIMAPTLLGMIFFGGGLYLFRYLVTGSNKVR